MLEHQLFPAIQAPSEIFSQIKQKKNFFCPWFSLKSQPCGSFFEIVLSFFTAAKPTTRQTESTCPNTITILGDEMPPFCFIASSHVPRPKADKKKMFWISEKSPQQFFSARRTSLWESAFFFFMTTWDKWRESFRAVHALLWLLDLLLACMPVSRLEPKQTIERKKNLFSFQFQVSHKLCLFKNVFASFVSISCSFSHLLRSLAGRVLLGRIGSLFKKSTNLKSVQLRSSPVEGPYSMQR